MSDTDPFNGGVKASALPEDVCVSFPVERLQHARVIWLNKRWWAEQGKDIDASDRWAVEDALVGTFGVRSCTSQTTGAGQFLLADRYGGTFGTYHGGSGRCGIHGGLIAKGIGRTPLAKPETSPFHTNGALSMAEAVREAVAGEISNSELPWGAVPAAAILATGETGPGEAILIRPNFVRPAHFERSIYFGTSGATDSDQFKDASRARSMVKLASSMSGKTGFPGVLEMLGRFADQIGAAHAHRLWQGRFLSSNASVSGALADFGSFRAVPSWHCYRGLPEEHFGKESLFLEVAFESIVRLFRRWDASPSEDLIERSRSDIRPRITRAFETASLDALQLGRASLTTKKRVLVALGDYFSKQQQRIVQLSALDQTQLPWVHSVLTGLHSDDEGVALVAKLTSAVSEDISVDRSFFLNAFARWTCPRPALSYEGLTSALDGLGAQILSSADGGVSLLAQAIDNLLSQSWRRLPCLPSGVTIHGQVISNGSAAFYGVNGKSGQSVVILSCYSISGRAGIFGRYVDVEEHTNATQGRLVSWIVPCADTLINYGGTVVVSGENVDLPPAAFYYPDHHNSKYRSEFNQAYY